MPEGKTVRVVVTGHVQGVWYRGWAVATATALGLDGWVRNCSDRSVEAVFSGPEALVDTMVEDCRRGPNAARVTGLRVEPWGDIPGAGFHQRPSV
jgi:acylphosphatase